MEKSSASEPPNGVLLTTETESAPRVEVVECDHQAPRRRLHRLQKTLKVVFAILSVIFVVAYPLAVWIGLECFSVRYVAAFLLALILPTAAVRIWRHRERAKQFAGLALSAAFLIGLAFVLNDERFMKAYPVIVSAVMLGQFSWTLFHPPAMVERFARMQTQKLTAEELVYCRRVTQVWCLFFALNGLICGILACLKDRSAWALYTGLISYVAMGLLFAIEFLLRKHTFRHHPPANALDEVADKIFPPNERDLALRQEELAQRQEAPR